MDALKALCQHGPDPQQRGALGRPVPGGAAAVLLPQRSSASQEKKICGQTTLVDMFKKHLDQHLEILKLAPMVFPPEISLSTPQSRGGGSPSADDALSLGYCLSLGREQGNKHTNQTYCFRRRSGRQADSKETYRKPIENLRNTALKVLDRFLQAALHITVGSSFTNLGTKGPIRQCLLISMLQPPMLIMLGKWEEKSDLNLELEPCYVAGALFGGMMSDCWG